MRRAAVLLLAACSHPTTSSVPSALTADQRVSLQAELDAGGAVSLPAGTFDIFMAPTPTFGRRAYDMITLGKGQSLHGVGVETVLRFHGDAGGQDWRGIAMRGDGAQLYDLTIDTSDLTNTGEQTHAVYVGGPIVNPLVTEVHFNHPVRGTQKGGDCIQLVGYSPDRLIVGARIISNHFDHCDRSGVGVHSGTRDLQITDNTFSDTGDQDIDGEGTGDNIDWKILRNTFETARGAQGDLAIQLQGVDGVELSDNVLHGRGIFMYGVQNATLAWNEITRTVAGSPTAVVLISKDSSDITFANNKITREASAVAGEVITAIPHGTGTPARITLTDNELNQNTNASVFVSSGLVGLDAERNAITYAGSVEKTYFGFSASGSATIRTDKLAVIDNTFTGALLSAVRVSGSYAGAGSVATSGNSAESPQGIRCESVYAGSGVRGPVTSARDRWPAPVCGNPPLVTQGP